jgi:hypothetical protein
MSAGSAVQSPVRTVEVSTGRYVQFGCGFCAPSEWENYDSSYTLRFERIPIVGRLYIKNSERFPRGVKYGDIVKGLKVPPDSCRGVYASHVLEHLSYEDCLCALRNTHRMLAAGGIFRLLVPDLEVVARQYLESVWKDPAANLEFMESTGLGRSSSPGGIFSRIYSALALSQHQWMWDYPSMIVALEKANFRRIRRCNFGDSEDPMFSHVEDPFRFKCAVALEGRK